MTPSTPQRLRTPRPRRPLSEGWPGAALLLAGALAAGWVAARGAVAEAALLVLLTVLGWRLRGRVITGRARERRAQEVAALQARLLDAVDEAVVACSADGRVTGWNRAATRLLGHGRTAMIGQSLRAVLPGVALAATRGHSRTVQLRHSAGGTITALASVSPLDLRAGAAGGWVLVLVDRTEAQAVERQQQVLVEAGAVLAAGLGAEATLVETARLALPLLADAGLVDLVEDGEIRRLATLHGHRRSAAVQEAVQGALPGRSGRPVEWPAAVWRRAAAGDILVIGSGPLSGAGSGAGSRAGSRAGSEIGVGDGSAEPDLEDVGAGVLAALGCTGALVVPVRARGRTLALFTFLRTSSRPGFDPGTVALARDLAERVGAAADNARLLEEAQLAARSKADFLAVMSHELRTPLTTIMGYTDLLDAGVPRPLEAQAGVYVRRVRGAAWQLLGVIEQILTYVRLDAGREQAAPCRASVGDFVQELAGLMAPVAAEKGVAFSAKAPADDVVVHTDTTRLRKVLLNLLSNAVKFTDGGVVALTATAQADHVVFQVRDTGVGIAPADLERVFDPFWQADQTSTRLAPGTGIGLSVARRLTRLLRGQIEVSSTPGEGTVFTVTIPVAWSAAAGSEEDRRAGGRWRERSGAASSS